MSTIRIHVNVDAYARLLSNTKAAERGFHSVQEALTGHALILRGDELRCPLLGTWKVCRVDYRQDLPEIICTNGARTRKFLRSLVHNGLVEHYRKGHRIEHRSGRRLRDWLRED